MAAARIEDGRDAVAVATAVRDPERRRERLAQAELDHGDNADGHDEDADRADRERPSRQLVPQLTALFADSLDDLPDRRRRGAHLMKPPQPGLGTT